MRYSRVKLGMMVLALAALAAACDEPVDYRTETQTVALEGATRAEVGLNMNAGELKVRAADQDALLEASFEYNRERDRPVVDYHRFGDKGTLQVRRARRHGILFGRVHNKWDLKLGKAVPIDLNVDLGAGKSDLDLRGLQIRRIEVDMGVGEMTLDIQGAHTESFDVKIDGGVGSAKLYLPAEVGVRVRVDGGIGSVNPHGLTKEGGAYVNDAYGRSAVTIEVSIDAGIGSVDLYCGSFIRT
jgi:N-terminal domain of toast_rack, DUF2154